MLFVSQNFLELFLPLTILAFYVSFYARPFLAVLALLAASAVFCGNNGASQSWLLAGSILFNFFTGAALASVPADRVLARKAVLFCGIAVDLLVLAYFKYSVFIVSNVNIAFGTSVELPHVVLPIGISFYTFTQIAFLADIYAGRGPSRLSLANYSLFVTYFPHVVAGPIIHWREMMPQFELIAKGTSSLLGSPEHRERICRSIILFGIGLAKKVLIADQLSPFVAKGFESVNTIGFNDAWLTSLAYTFQLYFDFSGYSDMAVGMSLAFGILLPLNFDGPYRADSIQDFWRRWHMTLSRWLRDYVFIPLGGSHGGLAATLRNLFLTFLLGGIWHGAAWTFVIWGALHGVACCVHRIWSLAAWTMPRPLAVLVTFLFVNAAWVFFRAPDVASAWAMLSAMVSPRQESQLLPQELLGLLALAALLTWGAPTSQRLALETRTGIDPLAASLSGAVFLLAILAQNSSTPSPFLYFSF